MFTVNLDENKYILSISHTKNDNVDIDISLLDFRYLNAYRLINSEIILDEEKKAQMVEEEQKRADEDEIADLEQKLNSTDYIFARELEEITALSNPITFVADVIKTLVAYASKYKDVIANRKAWRERIEELRGE